MNRWFRVAGGVGLNLCLGAASRLQQCFSRAPPAQFGWTRSGSPVAVYPLDRLHRRGRAGRGR